MTDEQIETFVNYQHQIPITKKNLIKLCSLLSRQKLEEVSTFFAQLNQKITDRNGLESKITMSITTYQLNRVFEIAGGQNEKYYTNLNRALKMDVLDYVNDPINKTAILDIVNADLSEGMDVLIEMLTNYDYSIDENDQREFQNGCKILNI